LRRGRLKAGPVTLARISTDDTDGVIKGYVAEGYMTDDPLKSFGGYGVVHIDDLQSLLEVICGEGFEHHAALNPGHMGGAIDEALDRYFGWEMYDHNIF